MEYKDTLDSLIGNIINGDNLGAQQDFESVIQQKMNDAIEAKKHEVAASIYGTSGKEDTEDSSEEEIDTEEEITDDTV